MKLFALILFTVFSLTGCNTEDHEATISTLEEEVTTLTTENTELTNQLEELNTEHDENLNEKNNIQEEYDTYKKRMEPYEDLEIAEAEARQIEAEQVAIKEEEERLAQEEAERKEAEEKEAQGYETGITYEQIARNPDDYIGEKLKFSGKVVQLIEGESENELRFAVDDDYDNMIYLAYDSSIVDQRILEDDYITIYGTSFGTITYESTMGGNITIPSVLVDNIVFD